MNEPKRLVEDGATPGGALDLLRSLQVPVGASPEKELELAGQLATGGAGAATSGGFASTLWGKLSLVSLVVALVGGVPLALRSHGASPKAKSDAVLVAAPRAAAPQAAPAPNVAEPPAAPEPVVSAPHAVNPAASAPTRKASKDALAEEEALLERARRLSVTAPREARMLLQQHARRYPNGQLTAERLYLSAEVAKRLGDSAGAAAQSKALEQRYPESRYAGRVAGATKPTQ